MNATENSSPLIIGHRGAMGHYPENTLPSFRAAFERGCHGIELDVQQSKDGEIVVFHDWDLGRCSSGSGLLIEHSAAELRLLDAGSWFHPEFAGTAIPTLQEVLDIVPEGKLINIEVKELYSVERGTIEKIVDILHKQPANQKHNFIISSFSHNLLARLHQVAPEIKIGLLLGNTLEELSDYALRLSFPIYSLHPYISLLKADEVLWAKRQGLKIYPWTVNQKYQVDNCRILRVDGIITNYPEILDLN